MNSRRSTHLNKPLFFNEVDKLQIIHIEIGKATTIEEVDRLSYLYDSQIKLLLNLNKQKIIKKYDELT